MLVGPGSRWGRDPEAACTPGGPAMGGFVMKELPILVPDVELTCRGPGVRLGVCVIVLGFIFVALWATPSAQALVFTPDGGWFWQLASPFGKGLSDVSFVDTTHGWAVGHGGTIMVTTDGGATWQNQPSGAGDVEAIAFVDTLRGSAVGGQTALSTTDGGLHWTAHTVSATGLHDVDLYDTKLGWAVGDAGAVLATTDGGVSWAAQTSGVDTSLTAVSFVDGVNGWAVGGDVVLTTTDAGAHWASTTPYPGYVLNDVSFADSTHGSVAATVPDWLWGTRGSVLRTTDGGSTWSDYVAGVVCQEGCAAVVRTDANHGWAAGRDGTIAVTTDGGATWSPQENKPPVHPLTSMSFVDNLRGWAVGDAGTIIATTNGGATWTACFRWLDAAPYPRGISFVDQEHGWLVESMSGLVFRTTDGGDSWDFQAPSTVTTQARAMDFVDATHGWIVGGHGDITATTDGGATWASQLPGWPTPLNDVAFASLTHGWAVGDGGTLLATTNGGQKWRPQKSGVTRSLWGVWFATNRVGWAVGAGGTILVTRDGGTTWRRQSSRTVSDFRDVAFGDATHGVAVGGEPRYTTDGGAHWLSSSIGWDWPLAAVAMIGTERAWGVTETGPIGGTIYASTDGGASWRAQAPCGFDMGMASISFVDATHGWVAGGNGTGFVLATTTGGVGSAPVTSSSVVSGACFNHDVTVTLSAVPGLSGAAVATTQWRDVNYNTPWTAGTSVAFLAPGDHSNDWLHVIEFRSIGTDGYVETTQILGAGIDTRPPEVRAKLAFSVTRGRSVLLKFQVSDLESPTYKAVVTVKVKNPARKVVKTLNLGERTLDRHYLTVKSWLSARLSVPRTWRPGTYRYFVYATDAAGNPQLKVASNKLIVK